MRKIRSSVFEHRPCGRCGGTGIYCHYGACFRCGGVGYRLTKRGGMAQEMFSEAARVPARDIEVGQMIQTSLGSPLNGMRYGFRPVIDVQFGVQEGASLRDGEMVPYRAGTVEITTAAEKDGSGGVNCTEVRFFTSKVRIALGAVEKAALIARCLAYQETLTASGTTRKRKAVTA